MALNALGLGLIFTARDAASGVIGKIGSKFEALEGKASGAAKSFSKAVGAFAIGVGVFAAGSLGVAAGFKLAGAAGEFGQGIAAVGAVSRATGAELRLLEESAIGAGIATQFSPQEAVDGLTSLATAGQTAAEATKTLIPVLDLAAGSLGQLGVAGAAEAVVGTLKSYGKGVEEAVDVTDKLLRITQLSNFQARDFGAGLAKAAAFGAKFNQTFEDTLITLGLLRNANIDASSAATAFREATRRLGSDQRAQGAITKLGIDVFDRQTRQMRPLLDIIKDFADATANLGDKERLAAAARAFGARGLLAFGAVADATFTKVLPNGTTQVLKGAEAISELRKQMANAAGTAAEFREKLLDTFKGQQTLLRGSISTFAVVFGKPFAQALKPVVSLVIAVLNAFTKTIQAMPEPIKKLLVTVFLLASAATAAAGAFLAWKAGAILAAAAMKVFGGALAGVAAVAGPVFLAILVLAAAGALLRAAWEADFGGLATVVTRFFSRIKLVFTALGQLITTGELSGKVLKEFQVADAGLQNFITSAFTAFARLQAFFSGFATELREALGPTISMLGEAFGGLFSAIGELLVQFGFADSKVAGTQEGFETFGRIIGAIAGGIVTVIGVFLTTWVSTFTGIIKVIKTVIEFANFMKEVFTVVFGAIFDSVISLLPPLGDLVKTVQIGAAAVGIDLGGPTAPGGPGPGALPAAAAAAGGVRPGVTAAVLQSRPEGGSVTREELASMMSAIQNQSIEITTQSILDGQQIAENQESVRRVEAATTFGTVTREG